MKSIDDYKKENRELRAKVSELSKYKTKYLVLRNWTISKFDWFVDMNADNKTPKLEWLIKNTRDVLINSTVD